MSIRTHKADSRCRAAAARPASRDEQVVRKQLGIVLSTLIWALWSAVDVSSTATDRATAGGRPVSASLTPGFPAQPASDPPPPTLAERVAAQRRAGKLRMPSANVAMLRDRDIEQRLIGAWTTTYHGVQRIVKSPDRTAKLVIDFDWIAALLYGSRMQLDLQWSVEQGVLTNRIERGTPPENVERLVADYSKSCSYLVLELSEDSLLLQEIDDPDTFHRWTRIESE